MKQINFGKRNNLEEIKDKDVLLEKLRMVIIDFLRLNGVFCSEKYVFIRNETIHLYFYDIINVNYIKAIGLCYLLFTEHNKYAYLKISKGRGDVEICLGGEYYGQEYKDNIKGLIEYIEDRKDVEIIYD